MAAAELEPQSMETEPRNAEMPTGSVRVARPERMSANMNSFQELSSTIILVVARPGATNGRQIRRNVCRREHPSTCLFS